jgi:hypothetical protein
MHQASLRINRDLSRRRPQSVSACCLGPELVAFLASTKRRDEILKSIFRVTVAQGPPVEVDGHPDVSGRYYLLNDEVRFVPHFPFESGVKYRVSFDPRPVGSSPTDEPHLLEFQIPFARQARAVTTVMRVFPSSDRLPENLLRFYVCFSNSMQHGRAMEEISLLDSAGRPAADALYRPPIELWDRSMRHLTVLLDPGRLKRRVGPNVELGPPLKAGHKYTLEIGKGMVDRHGRPLRQPFRKEFLAANPIREGIAIESWKVMPPATGSREALKVRFAKPLDWALLLQTITVEAPDGCAIDGQVAVDQCERRWRFTPTSPWTAGTYHVRVGSGLEDVCGNNITGAFDRALRGDADLETTMSSSPLTFQLE